MKEKVNHNTIEKLTNNVKQIRLLVDIINHKEVIESKKPENVYEHDNFLKKGLKKIKNTINDSSYKEALDGLAIKVEKYNSIKGIEEEIDENILSSYLQQVVDKLKVESLEISKEVFVNDSFKLAKMEFSISVIFDDYAPYISNDKTFKDISTILGEEESFLKDLQNDILNAYCYINNQSSRTNKLKISAALITGVALLGLVDPITTIATATAMATFSLTGFTVADKVLALCGANIIGYEAAKIGIDKLDIELQKKRLRDEFYSLGVEETAFSLATSIVMLAQLNKFRALDPKAEQLYEAYVENYIDIKSDVTLRLLMNEQSEVNYAKSKVYANADKFLAKRLQIV